MYFSKEDFEEAFYYTFEKFVRVYYCDSDNDYNKYVVEFEGIKGNVPEFVIDSSNLIGGKEGTKPYVKVTTVREGSNNLLFEPIVSEFLRAPSAKPSVQVKVNEVLSQCGGDCSY